MQERLVEKILEVKKKEIEALEKKETKILFESCPCCGGMGVMYVSRKGKALKIWCSCRKNDSYEDRRYYDKD